jgi:hypothetical protein
MQLYQVKIFPEKMIIAATGEDHAKSLAFEYIEKHAKKSCEIYAKELDETCELTINEMKATPYNAQSNESIGKIMMDASHDA